MDDWTPLAEAVWQHGGFLGGGVEAVAMRIRDGLLEVRADRVVAFSVPDTGAQASPGDAPFRVVPIGLPQTVRATHREEEIHAVFPPEAADLLGQMPPSDPMWRTGDLTTIQKNGVGRSSFYGLHVRTMAPMAGKGAEPTPPKEITRTDDGPRKGRPPGSGNNNRAAAIAFGVQLNEDWAASGKSTNWSEAARLAYEKYPDCGLGKSHTIIDNLRAPIRTEYEARHKGGGK